MSSGKASVASIISLVVSLACLAAAGWIVLNRQLVLDQVAVWDYQPDQAIAQLATTAQLNETGRFYFYATKPVIDGTSQFNQECQRQEAKSAILGCYVRNSIYIYDVKDPRLHGVKAVTAAHETLHVVYARLDSSEKQYVDQLLEAEFTKIKDPALQERMAYYSRTEPGQRDNELHSIIATEYTSVSPELEAYYSRYFTNRAALVALHEGYSDKFNELTQQRDDLNARMTTLTNKINTLTDQYNSGVKSLNDAINNFNSRASAGAFSSQAAFNSERSQLVDRSAELAALRESTELKTAEFETLRAEYNALVDTSNSLQKSLDSSLAPAPKI